MYLEGNSVLEINSKQNLIQKSYCPNKSEQTKCQQVQYTPSFKGKGDFFLEAAGSFMSKIERGGFLVLFLLQDFFGMTVPRSIAGFLRDKEETGKYNYQEGFEVLGREMLTGPCMMAVAPISLLLAAKLGHSTGINTQLIKRFGNSLKEMVSTPKFNKSILDNPSKFKEEFYIKNIENILNNTLGKENTSKESVEYILKQLRNMENIPSDAKLDRFRGKAKYRSQCIQNIVEHINSLKYSGSSDLNMLEKIKLSSGKLEDVYFYFIFIS